MKMNKNYIAPQISVIFVATSDVITTSSGYAFDSVENFMNDMFKN